MELILASQSPRRRELLTQMGLGEFRICAPDVDEHLDGRPTPQELVTTLSRRKADAVAAQAGDGALVIAADTVVSVDGVILGKPRSQADAKRMLTVLSGRSHEVYTGLTVLYGERAMTECEMTQVTFRPLTGEEIDCYIRTGEPMDKAGAYGIQGFGSLLVEGLHGDYFNVMGLPVCRLGRILAGLGVDCLSLAAEKTEEG